MTQDMPVTLLRIEPTNYGKSVQLLYHSPTKDPYNTNVYYNAIKKPQISPETEPNDTIMLMSKSCYEKMLQ